MQTSTCAQQRNKVRDATIRAEHADKDIQELRKELEILEKETAAQKHKIKSKVGPLVASQAPQPATPGAATIQVAPGFLIHSNHVSPDLILKQLHENPLLTGITPEQAAVATAVLLQIIQSKALQVTAPQQVDLAKVAPSDQSLVERGIAQAPAATPAASSTSATNLDDLTDVTDSETEMKEANEGTAPSRTKKRMTNTEKKARANREAQSKTQAEFSSMFVEID